MAITTAYSKDISITDAVGEIKKKAGITAPRLVLFFASSVYDPEKISSAMKNAFNDSQVIGCSTAGEIVSGHLLKQSIVAIFFDNDALEDAVVRIVENISTENKVSDAFKGFEDYYDKSMLEMDISEYVGLILIDGMSRAEERVMEKIGDLTDVPFIGGSAGDDLNFKTTYVYADGKAYSDSALLVLCKPKNGYSILKTQSFNSLNRKLLATKVDEVERTVLEFNNQSAIQVYAEALGTSIEEAQDRFMSNPVGLMIDGEPFVRSPQKIQGQDIVFYCQIKEGMELELLESRNIVKDTKKDLELKLREIGDVSGIINFHCILRTLELEKKDQTNEYGAIFEDIPTVGFSTYGEEYLGHINQTSTMLLIK